MSVNKVLLLGHLGADPELRYTKDQTPICNFRLATNDRRKGADGQWTDNTEWHRVVSFGRQAETCNQYLKKGRQVFVEGRIRTNKWQDQEGRDRYTTEIIAANVQFIGGRDSGFQIEQSAAPAGQQEPNAQGASGGSLPPIGDAVSFDDDDIPF